MFGKVHITEAALSQFLAHLVLSETAARVEILPASGIEDCFIFDVFEVVLEVLSAIGVEEPDGIEV